MLEFYDRSVSLVDEVGGLDHLLWRGLITTPVLRSWILGAHLHEHVLNAADVGAILAAPWLLAPFQVFGLGISVNPRLVKGPLKRLKLSPVGIPVGGGTPEAGPLPRGLRLQHDDLFGFRGDVSMSVASLERGSRESARPTAVLPNLIQLMLEFRQTHQHIHGSD